MNNTISIIMLGLVFAVCISFLLKGWRNPSADKEHQKWVSTCVAGSLVGFICGMVLGAVYPQAFFSEAFLKQEGAILGAMALTSIGFSVLGAIGSLLVFGSLRKKKA